MTSSLVKFPIIPSLKIVWFPHRLGNTGRLLLGCKLFDYVLVEWEHFGQRLEQQQEHQELVSGVLIYNGCLTR